MKREDQNEVCEYLWNKEFPDKTYNPKNVFISDIGNASIVALNDKEVGHIVAYTVGVSGNYFSPFELRMCIDSSKWDSIPYLMYIQGFQHVVSETQKCPDRFFSTLVVIRSLDARGATETYKVDDMIALPSLVKHGTEFTHIVLKIPNDVDARPRHVYNMVRIKNDEMDFIKRRINAAQLSILSLTAFHCALLSDSGFDEFSLNRESVMKPEFQDNYANAMLTMKDILIGKGN